MVAETVSSYLLPRSLGNAPPTPLWRSSPLAGTGVRLPAKTSIILEISKVPKNWRSFCARPERMRLCCRIQCTDSLHPNGSLQRRKLFTASLKLLQFAVGIETFCCENEEQRALKMALLPFLRPEDGHVLATLSAIAAALLGYLSLIRALMVLTNVFFSCIAGLVRDLVGQQLE